METITTISQLDEKIAECHRAAAISDTELRKVFDTFRMQPPLLPGDPFSEEYKSAQMVLYEQISGRSYRLENEAYPCDVTTLNEIFPYSTKSQKVIGEQYVAIGEILRRLEVGPPARIIEFGAGWGNTSLALASSGYDVTIIDVENGFCKLIERRAKEMNLPIRAINADFMWAETADDQFDAAIFFECFHHCADHHRLLRAMHRIIKPGGYIHFAGEPIMDDFPVPWGIRMNGESLWAIRQNGWLELGFHEAYFREVLQRTGWNVKKNIGNPDIPITETWTAQATPS